jgi:hypothetical protein
MIPDIVIQRAIINGFRALRKDARIIDMIFRNLPRAQIALIKQFVQEKNIDFSINYPRSDIKVPAIVMLMKNESEAQTFLGDVMGAGPHYDMPDNDSSYETLNGNGQQASDMDGLPRRVIGGLRVLETLTGSQSVTFVEDDQELIVETFSTRSSWEPLKLHVVGGTGKGKVYDISQISTNQLDIVGTFDVDLDSTSVVDIRYSDDPEGAYGEPQRVYDADSTSLLRLGANYDTQYQLEVLAGNQEEVIYLYAILKAVLLSQRSFLEAQGIMAMKITGSDFAPRSEFLPDEVFMRNMIIQFTYPFTFLVEQDVATAIDVTLTSVDPDDRNTYPGSEVILTRIEL